MKSVFSQVKDSLKSLYLQEPMGHTLTRLNSLCALITGMVLKKSSNLPDLGSGLPQDIDMSSRVTHAKRFLSNKWVDFDAYYLPFFSEFLKHFLSKSIVNQEVKLVIDGSQMGSNHVALVVSLVWCNRSIPICWLVRKGKKGHFPEEMHLKVLEQTAHILQEILPEKTKVVLLGDGEFDGVELQKLCRDLSWNYVCRTACDTILYENGDSFQPQDTTIIEGDTFFFMEGVDFSKAMFRDVNFLHWHDMEHPDPIYLISSLDDPFDIIRYYRFRFSIETMFKDLKTRGFNLHKTRLGSSYDISNLLIIGSLSFCFIMKLADEYQDSPLRKKVQEKKNGQKQLSVFSFGLKLFHYLVDKGTDFVFSLTISRNSS